MAQPRDGIDATLLALIRRGHYAASFEAEQIGGKMRVRWARDAGVRCCVRFGGQEQERAVADLWRLMIAGHSIEDVAPTTGVLHWQAVAAIGSYEILEDGSPAFVVYVTEARDNTRGLAALFYSQELPRPRQGTMGDRMTRFLQTTTIDGAAARIRKALERLSPDEARAATAAAATFHLKGEGAWSDGGIPPVQLKILATNTTTGTRRVLASIGKWDTSQTSKRRSRLFHASTSELEREAFGGRGNTNRTFVPLAEDDHVGAFVEAQDVVARLDLADLVARAGLTERELEAFELWAQDMSYAEIAAALDVAEGTVGALLSTARRKLRAEAETSFSDYRRSA